MDTLCNGLGHKSVIRVMPNTPAQVGAGMTLWTCSEGVDASKREMTKRDSGVAF